MKQKERHREVDRGGVPLPVLLSFQQKPDSSEVDGTCELLLEGAGQRRTKSVPTHLSLKFKGKCKLHPIPSPANAVHRTAFKMLPIIFF